jgi:hypothetical protein
MLTIDTAINFLLSSESKTIQIPNLNILKKKTILTLDNIQNMNHNIIDCFLFYLKEKLTDIETNDTYISFVKFFKLKILEKNFLKKLNINFPINKQLYLKTVENNFNDCFGILFLSEFFNINTIINISDKNYIITDGKQLDNYKPYIILVYSPVEDIYIPTFEAGSSYLTFNYQEFTKIVKDKNTHIVNINLKNANTKIVSLQTKSSNEILSINSDDLDENDLLALTPRDDSDELDDTVNELDTEVKQLISKTDAQLMKEKKELLLTVIGRLKLYQKGYEKKKKADLVSIIRTYK